MSTEQTKVSGNRQRYPRYLIEQEARTLIDRIRSAGVPIGIFVPALGSIEVIATLPDDATCCEQGRPEALADVLRRVAERCGVDLSD